MMHTYVCNGNIFHLNLKRERERDAMNERHFTLIIAKQVHLARIWDKCLCFILEVVIIVANEMINLGPFLFLFCFCFVFGVGGQKKGIIILLVNAVYLKRGMIRMCSLDSSIHSSKFVYFICLFKFLVHREFHFIVLDAHLGQHFQ